jgi:hypothetical protein
VHNQPVEAKEVNMWGFIKKVGRAIRDGIGGTVSTLWNGLKWAIHRIFGIFEMIGSFFGFMPTKKLKVKVVILLDAQKQPIASRADVDKAVSLAKEVFKDQAHVRIISPTGPDELIVGIHPEPAPEFVMNPLCDGGGFGQVFTRVGRWFRRHSARTHAGSYLGYGSPATIFVVNDVQKKNGCFIGVATDYGYIDGDALGRSEGVLLTLAHELGHACDLFRHKDRTLMESGPGTRSRRLTRRQRAIVRSSPRVTFR